MLRLNFKINDPCEPINLSHYALTNFIINLYREKLSRNPSQVELRHFTSEINSKNIKKEDFVKTLDNCEERKTLLISNWDGMPEPYFIFVSCFNEKKQTGGIFVLQNSSLIPLIEGSSFHGLYYSKKHNILFGVTRINPQILAFQITSDYKILRIPIEFTNYVFANDAHGILIHDDKIFVVATQGEEPPTLAEHPTDYGKFVGKIIISELNIKDDIIQIKNSKIFNPFDCGHHHHINDLCEFENSLYLSSFSFCDSGVEMKNGVITKLNFSGKPIFVIANNLDKPHSLKYFKHTLYTTSSGSSSIFSINSEQKKLEYKGPDVFVRGLVVTENYMYFGTSWGLGRTNSKFANKHKGLLRFDRTSGETIIIPLPEEYDNVYGIESDWP